jgi:hypothetical protein
VWKSRCRCCSDREPCLSGRFCPMIRPLKHKGIRSQLAVPRIILTIERQRRAQEPEDVLYCRQVTHFFLRDTEYYLAPSRDTVALAVRHLRPA